MKLYILLFVFILSSFSFAAKIPIHLVEHADSIDKALTIRHQDLAEYLTIATSSDREKVLIFAYWIAKNIHYDKNELKRLDRNKIPREVLDNRRAVCGGYSNLFEQLCEDASILAYSISGYSHGKFFKRTLKNGSLKHGWNVVYLNGKWELVDVTWCTEDSKEKKFKENLELKWIFMDPLTFSQTHFPNDPQWQLLDQPKTKREFWSQQEEGNWKIDSQNELKPLSELDKVDGRLISIKSQFATDQNKKEYLNNLLRLAWDCSGGSGYDESKIKKGLSIFQFSELELNRIQPTFKKKKYYKMIKTGIYISNKRLEQKE